MSENIEKAPNVPPFVRFVCSAVPMVFDDSLSYYEALSALWKYMQDTVNVINNNATVTEEYIQLTKDMKEYMDNYFDNLDVQEEINNKLDKMVTDGTMDTIINQEIFGDINSRLNLLDQKKYIFIGDSYCEGWTPDGNVESWAVNLKRKLGLTDANCKIAYHGGYGFASVSQSFSSILDSLTADSDVTDIVVCGGYNDLSGQYLAIFEGVRNFINVARNKFPNAKIHVGFIGFSNNPSQRNNIRNTCRYYREIASLFPESSYLSNVEYSLKNVYKVFASDGIHPNADGQESIARNLKNALASGSADAGHGYLAMNITPDTLWDGNNENLNSFGTSFNNGLTTIECVGANKIIVKSSTGISEWSGNMSWQKIGNITDGHIVGNSFNSIVISVPLVIGYYDSWIKYKSVQGLVRFENKEMSVCYLEANTNGYVTTNNVREIQIGKFSGSFNSLFC